nr:hypothetical protein [Tanacetum cinerariifolium]
AHEETYRVKVNCTSEDTLQQVATYGTQSNNAPVYDSNGSVKRLRIKQYFQIQDYALWDVIENGNSFKPIAETTIDDAGTSTTVIPGLVTIEEKDKKKNDEDLNLKFLRSLPSDWNTHVIDEDDMEEIDIKWNMALLSMRANKFWKKTRKKISIQGTDKTGKKITINGGNTAGYDKYKVECFNCHKMGHFTRECGVQRNQENRTRNQETTRRIVNVEDTSSKAMVAIEGAGFDWSYMADDEAPTNMAFMALSDLEIYTDNTCSKTCLTN